ncbi:hypothetical protein [Bdellovibrio sp. HCB337]|uniref:hypothetical protein n=1 Tax=Bdellovibrio sp. HCB337 TaxID=3394358 RepID=UPI0039A72A89
MSEILFVVKCLVLTVLLTVFMQVKVGSASIEAYSQNWLQRSSVSIYIQSVAAGGALALKNLFYSVKSGATDTAASFRDGVKAQTGR